MCRNYISAVAWALVIVEFTTPFVVDIMFPEWMQSLGPGGPYVAAYWLGGCSLVGGLTAAIAVALSYRGFKGRVASFIALAIHVVVGAIPVVTVLRLIFGLY